MEGLQAYAEAVGADATTWMLVRPTHAELGRLAQLAGITISFESGRIVHSMRLLVLDGDGRLVERYDDLKWSQERVVRQLR